MARAFWHTFCLSRQCFLQDSPFTCFEKLQSVIRLNPELKLQTSQSFSVGRNPGSYLSFPWICNPQGDHRGRNVPHIYQSMLQPAKEYYPHKYNKIHFWWWGFGIFFMICIYEVLPKASPLVITGIDASKVIVWRMSELMS